VDEATPDEIKYFTPEGTCLSVNTKNCDDKGDKQTPDAPPSPRFAIENVSGDVSHSLEMDGFPISDNVDNKTVRKNNCTSDITVERARAESPGAIGADLTYILPQSKLSLCATLQDNVDGAMVLDAQEIDSERYFLAREQKKIASVMTPESVWRLVPSMAEAANSGSLTDKADLRKRAMEVYEKHFGRSVYDPKRMKYKADNLWECGRYRDAEELDRLTIEIAHEELGQEHPYTLKLMGNLAAAIFGQGRLEEAEKIELEVVRKMRDKLGEYDEYTLEYMGNLCCHLPCLR
jgi:hypothetical protein